MFDQAYDKEAFISFLINLMGGYVVLKTAIVGSGIYLHSIAIGIFVGKII